MTRKIFKTKLNRKIILESFESYSDLIKTNDSRDNNFGHNRNLRSTESSTRCKFDFQTYDQAVSQVYNYDKHLPTFKSHLKTFDSKKTVQHKKTRNVIGVAGYQPVIANALMGLPKAMISTQIYSKKSKILNVYLDGNYAAGTTPSEIVYTFTNVLAYLFDLEQQGFRIRLHQLFIFGQSYNKKDPTHICKILLKSENQPFDIKRLMFPITNLGAFRLFGFDWYERLPSAVKLSGYGNSFPSWNQDQRTDVLDALGELNSKAYIINHKQNVQQVFENIK